MELERKYKVINVSEVINNALDIGFKKYKDKHQKDDYLLMEKDVYLRLREDTKSGKVSLDFHEIINDDVTKETEISLSSISDLEKMKYILSNLGYKSKCLINKKRERYNKDNVSLVYDQVRGLGEFIEIEILADDNPSNIKLLEETALSIGLKEEEDRIKGMGYPDLFLQSRNK